MDHGDAVCKVAIGYARKTNPFKDGRQFLWQREFADGFRKICVGLPGAGEDLARKGHDVKGIKIIKPPEPP